MSHRSISLVMFIRIREFFFFFFLNSMGEFALYISIFFILNFILNSITFIE